MRGCHRSSTDVKAIPSATPVTTTIRTAAEAMNSSRAVAKISDIRGRAGAPARRAGEPVALVHEHGDRDQVRDRRQRSG